MIKKLLLYLCSVIVIALMSSCAEERLIDTIQSESFKVETRERYDYLNIYASPKGQTDERQVISLERDPYVNMRLLDDSILIVTDLAIERYDFIANLEIQEECLNLGVGKASLLRDAFPIDTLVHRDWEVAKYNLKRPMWMFILCVLSPYDVQYGGGPDKIIILGAREIELLSVKDGLFDFAVIWQNSQEGQSPQNFRIDFPDKGVLTPERFSVLP
ncbi:MAG: hypothetical protein KAR42_14270 [candidate division Zixibacteria bacterium]|nr:hypothetical protein [candidate division Zixibacteria bacterium]